MSLFVRKPMAVLMQEAQETGSHTLKRTLGAGGLIALGIGAIIGAGLFSITGMAAANHAGPAITISFVPFINNKLIKIIMKTAGRLMMPPSHGPTVNETGRCILKPSKNFMK